MSISAETAASSLSLPSDMSELDKAVFIETNKLRKEPLSFVPYLETMLTHFRGNILVRPGQISILTSEGPAAV